MIDVHTIRGVIFDYGGTIDSNGVHWAEVIWKAYQTENVPITKELFREAYIHSERTLGKNPIIQPYHTFLDMLRLKIAIQFEWLNGIATSISASAANDSTPTMPKLNHLIASTSPNGGYFGEASKHRIANYCYDYAHTSVEKARPTIEWIAERYPVALVSNFYGNMASVLKDFGIERFFPIIIESAIVGVRKPDPQIFRLGVEALQLQPDEVVVIGDSYDKDIIPATITGCQTIWLKHTGWTEYKGAETADLVIDDFTELKIYL